MHRRMIAVAFAAVLPVAAAAQAPVSHPPGSHESAPAPPHPGEAHRPVPPVPPHPPSAHEAGQPHAPTAHPTGAHEAAPTPSPVAQKSYIPGIEQFMNVIQAEHTKLWYAGEAGNWPLAAYNLAEIKEVMSDLEDLFPTFKSMPFAKMLDDVIVSHIAVLEKAVDAKDAKAFAAGYDRLTAACNACHQATGNGFLVMRRPIPGAFPDQDFKPRKQ
jgi:hypothetical protein